MKILPYGWEIRRWITKKLFPDHPAAASLEEWAARHKKDREDHPFRYWIDNEFVGFFTLNAMRLSDVKYWFLYRLHPQHMHHLVNTGLDYGYYDNDTIILHANFNILKRFVEIEKSHLQHVFNNEPSSTPASAGLKYLDWECGLRYSETDGLDADDIRIGELTQQAINAQEIKELYIWWTEIRPNRPNPYLLGEERESIDIVSDNRSVMEIMADRTPEQKETSQKLFEKQEQLKDLQHNEDTDMLCRLVRIRKAMWA